MKKLGVGALVGGLILFIWQFLSYGVLDLHYSQMAHTPAQDDIMEVLESSEINPGEYYMIRAPKGNGEQQEALMQERIGKPWAMVHYHAHLQNNMVMNMLRALIIDILAVFILAWILLNYADLSMKASVLSAVGVGVIGYLSINYLDAIWFETNSLPDLLDAILPWAIIGGWLGWWLRR